MNGRTETAGGTWSGVAAIVLCGVVLGVAYNYLGLISRKPWGLPWVAEDKVAAFQQMAAVTASPEPASAPPVSDDPLAIPAAPTGALPVIPDVGRPVPIDLAGLKQFVDAGAAVVVDARDPDEYVAGHIPGAVNLPYDAAISDPERLEAFDPGGKPVITYCGGGTCEVSLSLANELVFSRGLSPVAVYMGGFPEWEAKGYPVTSGAEP